MHRCSGEAQIRVSVVRTVCIFAQTPFVPLTQLLVWLIFANKRSRYRLHPCVRVHVAKSTHIRTHTRAHMYMCVCRRLWMNATSRSQSNTLRYFVLEHRRSGSGEHSIDFCTRCIRRRTSRYTDIRASPSFYHCKLFFVYFRLCGVAHCRSWR